MNNLPLQSILGDLKQTSPPKGLIHIGSGGGPAPFGYLEWGLSNLLLLDAKAAPVKKPGLSGVTGALSSRHALVGPKNGAVEFILASNPSENGLVAPETLAAFWPNLRTRAAESRTSITLDTLLGQEADANERYNWLIISCFPAASILGGAAATLSHIDVIVARVVTAPSASLSGADRFEVDELLIPHDFEYCGFFESLHPNIGHGVYAKAGSKAKALETAIPARFRTQAAACFKNDDPFQAIDAVLLAPQTGEKDKLFLSIAVADQLLARRDKMASAGLLRTAREYLRDSDTWDRYLLISRLLHIGEIDDALELVLDTYLYGNSFLMLSSAEKAQLSGRLKANLEKLRRSEQHGHALLLEYLDTHQRLLRSEASSGSKVLVEIGTTRENVRGQGSTRLIADFCQKHELHFITVDMDPHNTQMAAAMFVRMGVPFEAINMKGEDFLRNYTGRLDFVFLDAYDFDHGKHTDLRQNRYKKFLGNPINDTDCHKMHLDCAESIVAKLATDGVVCFDDTWVENGQWTAKGALAMPYLLQYRFSVVEARNRAALLIRDKVDTHS